MPIRVTLGFKASRASWTEEHVYNQASSPAFSSLPPDLNALVAARAQLLGAGVVLNRIRLSNLAANRITEDYLYPEVNGQSPYVNSNVESISQRAYNAAPANYCLSVLMYGPAGQSTRLYLAGCPQGIFLDDSANQLGWDMDVIPNYWTAVNGYLAYLAGGKFGWLSQTGQTYYDVVWPLQQNPNYSGLIGLATPQQLFGGTPGPRSQVIVKGFRRLSTRIPKLGGVYYVQPPQLTVTIGGANYFCYFLQQTQGVSPTNFLQKSPGSIGVFTPVLVNYVNFDVDYATSRKRGASFERPRGRSSIRS